VELDYFVLDLTALPESFNYSHAVFDVIPDIQVQGVMPDYLIASIALVPEEAFVDFDKSTIAEPADGNRGGAGVESNGELLFRLL
jgi:hypothetical protein